MPKTLAPTAQATWKLPGTHSFRAQNCDNDGIYEIRLVQLDGMTETELHSQAGVVEEGEISTSLVITSDPGAEVFDAKLYLDKIENGEPTVVDFVDMKVEGTSGGS